MSLIITPILNSLAELTYPTITTPRHVALQPDSGRAGDLDLGRFLSPSLTR